MVSETFDASKWFEVPGFDLQDITYHRAKEHGTVRIAFNRPEVRNAFRPATVDELYRALDHARQTSDVGCVLLTGNGPSPKDGGWAFCSGGDQRIRGKDGYKYETGSAGAIDPARLGRLHILEVQRLIRFMPKVVIAVVPGWAVGGGHSLHVVCDMTIASEEHALFKQTDPDVASFDSDNVLLSDGEAITEIIGHAGDGNLLDGARALALDGSGERLRGRIRERQRIQGHAPRSHYRDHRCER